MVVYEVESCIRGFHMYQDTWTPVIGEELHCAREGKNIHDHYAVVVKKERHVVGQVPRKVSAACTLFLQKGGDLKGRITAARHRYSTDLPQGGLEIPCKLVFSGQEEMVAKIRKLIPDNSHLASVGLHKEQNNATSSQSDTLDVSHERGNEAI